MITAINFKKYWEENLSEYEDGLVRLKSNLSNKHKLTDETYDFLVNFGLPDAAAPFLTFDIIGSKGLKHIFEIWGNSDDYNKKEKERLGNYLVIGSDGSGNPLAIDISNNSIVHLDHDDSFNTVQFVNSGIFQLAEFLLEVREMVTLFNKSNEPRNTDDEIPKEYKTKLLAKLKKIDSKAIDNNYFWTPEISML